MRSNQPYLGGPRHGLNHLASAEIVASTCRLLSYGGHITTVEAVCCDFMERGRTVIVNSSEHQFSFLAAEQGKT